MLQPTDRRLLFDALAPPSGFKLDFAVSTTYTLDLFSLLSAPVAFAFSDWQDRDGRPTGDPLALLKAVREYADRICLFFQAGRIHVPQNYQPLLASVESSLVETLAPRGGSFHPKVWFLRFEGEYGEVHYRFLCLSRNMTFDRAWDTMLCLEGPLTERTNAFTQNHPLGRFVEALPNMAIRGVSKSWKKRINDLAYEIRRVDFERPDMVEQLQFWPIGIDPDSDPGKDWPFGESKRTLVISPFLSGTALSDLASTGTQVELVSRAEQLERVKPETLRAYSNVWILDDTAEPEPSEAEELNSGTSGENESPQPAAPALVGLHAKLYVLDYGREASVFTGSANATHTAFNRNVEFLTELRGKKSKLGVAAVLGEATDPSEKKPGAASLADLLRPFKPGDGVAVEESTEDKFERLVDEIAKQLAKAEMSAECQEASDGSGFCVCLLPSRRTRIVPDPAVVVSVRPASRPHAPFVRLDANELIWAKFDSLAMLSLTSFYVFRVETDSPKRMAREFVLNIPLTNEPSGRREALLKHLLSDKERVLRFLMLLLSDADADAFANMFNGTDGGSDSFQFSSLLNGPTLFESLMRCVERDPARLEQVAEIIGDLEKSSDGRELLPEELDAIWRPIWNVALRQLARGLKRGKA
jgi:hypothetical protein